MKLFKNRAVVGLLVLGSLLPLTFAGERRGRGPATVRARDRRQLLDSRRLRDHGRPDVRDQRRRRAQPAAGSFVPG